MKTKLLFLLLIQIVFVSCQKKVTDFKLVSYDLKSNNELSISAYTTLDKDGVLSVYLDRERDKVFYQYKLSHNELDAINNLSDKNLDQYVIKKALDANQGYAGSRNYLSFKVNGKEDKICFILPFMDSDFKKVIDSLEDKIYLQDDSQRTEAFTIDFKKTEKEIITQNQIDNYLPNKSLPPPPMR
ncbi:hypothetical protein [Chryseobacterium aquaticum]|uniref:Lipoprotein n=1 Tax=Chryseobacterium aquaticum subsp. greenlandense TaxID=345663 RepID=A0A101CHR9_9FLAO|nr:hypothetical protein [Chryseobacterium aquaticum]KUJ56387.1 hypothetical protein AR686_07435 [Chryseobacterium aquaticum subsp. greenlandense]